MIDNKIQPQASVYSAASLSGDSVSAAPSELSQRTISPKLSGLFVQTKRPQTSSLNLLD